MLFLYKISFKNPYAVSTASPCYVTPNLKNIRQCFCRSDFKKLYVLVSLNIGNFVASN